MALIKFGGGIVAMSGSMAGNTFARNHFGFYMRARTKPVNPNSALQVAARARLTLLAEEWSATLTAIQRGGWETYAAAIAWQNKLGETVQLTGFNHFIRSNSFRLICGESILAVAPIELTLPGQDPTFSIAFTAATNQFTETFDDTLDWTKEDEGHLILDLGQPQSISRTFFGGPWRQQNFLTGIDPGGVASPQGPFASDNWTLIEGQQLWSRIHILREDGRVSGAQVVGPTTVAA